MNTRRPDTAPGSNGLDRERLHEPADVGRRHGGHGPMMLLMCVPMLLIAGVLIATGAGFGAVLPALLCVAMMAAMMLFMPGGRGTS